MKLRNAAALSAALWCSTVSSVHADGPIVTLSGALLERELDRFVGMVQLPESVSRKGSVRLRRRDGATVVLEIPLRYAHQIDLTMHLELEFACAHRRFGVFAGHVWYEANDFLSAIARLVPGLVNSIEQQVADQLEGNLFPATTLDTECPGIDVQSDAGLRIDFGPGSECAAGQTISRACPAGTWGTGLRLSCADGRWEVDSDSCEPNASPGEPPR